MNKLLLPCVLVCLPGWVLAQGITLESDVLRAKVGSSGDRLGAEVKQIRSVEGQDGIVIDISLPLEDARNYESVEVLSGDEDTPLPQIREHVWMDDYEKNHYGLRLYLKRNPRIGFRLRLMDVDGDNR